MTAEVDRDLRRSRVRRACYVLAAVLIASGIVHLGVQAVLGGPWAGPVSWRKPVTFGFAFGVTLATLTWVTGYLPMRDRLRDALLSLFALACAAEVTVITVQAWRGVPSHFNVSTPVNASFAFTAAAGGAVLIATTVGFAIAAFRPGASGSPSMRLALRSGFGIFLVALGIGAVMIAIGVTTTRTVSQAAAYDAAGGLTPAHFAAMHAILVLPGLAWLVGRTGWTEERRTRVVALGCAAYLLVALVVALIPQ